MASNATEQSKIARLLIEQSHGLMPVWRACADTQESDYGEQRDRAIEDCEAADWAGPGTDSQVSFADVVTIAEGER